jgi:hypothetical protein
VGSDEGLMVEKALMSIAGRMKQRLDLRLLLI